MLLAVSAGEVVTKTAEGAAPAEVAVAAAAPGADADAAGRDPAPAGDTVEAAAALAVAAGPGTAEAAGVSRSRSVQAGRAACDSTRTSIACDCAVPFSLTSSAASTVSPKLIRRALACSSIGACAVVPSCQRASAFCTLVLPMRKPVPSRCPRVDIAGQRPVTRALAVSAPLGAAAPGGALPGAANSRHSGASRASAGRRDGSVPGVAGSVAVEADAAVELDAVAVRGERAAGERRRAAVVVPGGATLQRHAGQQAGGNVDVGVAPHRGQRFLPAHRADRRRGPEVEAAADVQPVRPLAPGRAVRSRPPGSRVELIQVQAALQVPGCLRRRPRRGTVDRGDGTSRPRFGAPDLDPRSGHTAVQLQFDGARRAALGQAPLHGGADLDRWRARGSRRRRRFQAHLAAQRHGRCAGVEQRRPDVGQAQLDVPVIAAPAASTDDLAGAALRRAELRRERLQFERAQIAGPRTQVERQRVKREPAFVPAARRLVAELARSARRAGRSRACGRPPCR
jgi:hypothetical protein